MSSDADKGHRTSAFDADLAREMFSVRGKSPSGEGVDVSIVRRHYHPEVHFRDPIQEVQGRDALIELLLRFAQRCKELRCTVHRVAQEGNVIFVEWTTDALIREPIPPLVDHGCSRLLVDDDGLVIDHRDYFDLWGDMIDAFPRVSRAYRSLVRHME